ncbi:hypothetical protein [Arhodomonas sp. AD133]|uniref:hypothetical protein n=1 Tax=Arhodomonas sp. AD133 TaxID=3415009 RepID=UPI003EBD9F7C
MLGYVRVDIKHLLQMPDQNKGQYLFVAVDQPGRLLYAARFDGRIDGILRVTRLDAAMSLEQMLRDYSPRHPAACVASTNASADSRVLAAEPA